MITGHYTFRGLGQATPDQTFCAPDPTDPANFEVCTGITYGTPGATGQETTAGTPGTAAAPGAPAATAGQAAGGATGTPYGSPTGSAYGSPTGSPGGFGLGLGPGCASLLGGSTAAQFVCQNFIWIALGAGAILLFGGERRRGGKR